VRLICVANTSAHFPILLTPSPPAPPDSDLLSPEAAGDIALLPHGRVTPELFLALRALCAPAREFDSWAGLEDALRAPAGCGGGVGKEGG
jgi:hypothetical protein